MLLLALGLSSGPWASRSRRSRNLNLRLGEANGGEDDGDGLPIRSEILQRETHTAVAAPPLLDQPTGLGSHWIVVRRLWTLEAGQGRGK